MGVICADTEIVDVGNVKTTLYIWLIGGVQIIDEAALIIWAIGNAICRNEVRIRGLVFGQSAGRLGIEVRSIVVEGCELDGGSSEHQSEMGRAASSHDVPLSSMVGFSWLTTISSRAVKLSTVTIPFSKLNNWFLDQGLSIGWLS